MSAPEQPTEPARWLDNPRNVNVIIVILCALCAAVVIADFFYAKHGHYGFEDWIGFHAVYGFATCAFIVIAATQMRKIVMRDEDYYD